MLVLVGAGLRGVDPFSSILPAVSQTAQMQKMIMQMEEMKRKMQDDVESQKNVFATDIEIREQGFRT